MADFLYQASNAQGNTVRGAVAAGSAAQAMALLQAQELRVFSIKPSKATVVIAQAASESVANIPSGTAPAPSAGALRKVPAQALALLWFELATLLDAGVPLADAVLNAAQGRAGLALGAALQGVYTQLRAGNGLSVALQGSGLQVPRYALELVRSGEMTGKIALALRAGGQQLEQQLAFAREARNALIYPLVLVLSGLGATLMVFVFVVPKFAGILTNPKADIPLFSLWVLRGGLWLAEHQLTALGALALAVLGALAVWRSSAARQALWDVLAQAPLSARWVAHAELARWATMLRVMLHTAVPLLDALALARTTLVATVLHAKAGQIMADVRGGKTLGDSMRSVAFADGTTVNLVAVGERSGALAHTTQVIGEMHRTQSQQLLKRFLVLLEPLTILAISVVLGGIMISVMLAVTSLTNVI